MDAEHDSQTALAIYTLSILAGRTAARRRVGSGAVLLYVAL
jgi:hypothetical protein